MRDSDSVRDQSPLQLLGEWRQLERQQETVNPDDRQHDELELEIARLRSEYHRISIAAVARFHQRPGGHRNTPTGAESEGRRAIT